VALVAAAFAIAVMATPAGISGAVLLLPFQVSVLGTPSPAVTPTNLRSPVAPAWPTGVALGIGGLAGGYTGARLQSRLPDALIRRVVGLFVVAIGARYLWSGL
jgi:uncharacterized membrane protein YfcA